MSLPNSLPCRVLIVEDHPDVANVLRMLLDLWGHPVRVAYTGPDGVQAARAWRPDVVLCDIGLPGLDGFGVARALRADPTTAHARLVAITGYSDDDVRRQALASGFDFFVPKPADPAVVQRLLAIGEETPAIC